MYLKSIKAKGFKSFADQTVLEFKKGINGVVGPNGSGKSNVVDAVRWVLGEQSVKSLRGDGAMTDVIFSGSKTRGPMNTAQVTVVFDNTDKYLPLPYDEVEIKRRVYKDGSNEYYLNGEKVRLKDITNLLLDSGVAKESFNIISQGQIEAIISSRPEGRRVIFEEASGVLKYKRRKEEAIKKLEKTKDNMNRVSDILKELEERIEPLKEEREKALEYKDAKDKLENLDIALITEDITNLNYEYQTSKDKLEQLNKLVTSMISEGANNEAEIEKYKLQITKLDEEIKQTQKNVMDLVEKTEQLNSRKTILNERKKYEVEDSKLHEEIINLKEKGLTLENEINNQEKEIIYIEKDLKEAKNKIEKENSNLNEYKRQKQIIQNNLTNKIRNLNNIEIKIESLKENIENGGPLPLPVKSVLSNPKLRGIHNALGNLIEIEEKYTRAITTSLGYMVNNIIVDDEVSAKEAIRYLKDIGRATFFPLNIIKPKYIDTDTLNIIKEEKGFIDIASNLVKYDNIYKNIILNQLGNIIVTKNIDEATKISKKINNRYKIVTIDGEIIHVGGSMTGGKQAKQRNIITDKYELEEKIKQKDQITNEIKELENQTNEIDYNLKQIEDKLYLLEKDKLLWQDNINNKKRQIQNYKKERQEVIIKTKQSENIINGNITKEEENILNEYYESLRQKDEANKLLQSLIREKDNINDELEEYEITRKKKNNIYNEKMTELKNLEINVNRLDVKLDNLLNNLTENMN